MRTSADIRSELFEVQAKWEGLVEGITASGRESLTPEEEARADAFEARSKMLQTQLAEADAHGGMLQEPRLVGVHAYEKTHAGATGSANWGFENPDVFMRALAKPSPDPDPRLIRNVATYGSEGVAADGGYALPPDFRTGVQRLLAGPDSLFGLLSALRTSAYTITLPTDEDPPWSSSGIVESQVAEATAPTATKPIVRQLAIPLLKYSALIPASYELIEDSPGFGQYVIEKSADKILWKLNVATFNALLGATCKITTPKGATASGQPPSLLNVQAMWSNLAPVWRHDAVWIANATATMESALQGYQLSGWPIYIPAGVNGNPFPILMGRRIIFSEVAAANGTEGDLVLVSPSMVYGAARSDSPAGSTSIHLYFDQDLMAFKVIARAAVKPKLSQAVTRPDSSTVSPIITCQSR